MNAVQVPRLKHVNQETFERIVEQSQPVILEDCNFGDCMSRWTLDYLTQKLADQDVVIHESDHEELSFIEKNFRYRTCKFREFSERLSQIGHDKRSIYLRSTHNDPRAKKAARIEDDFHCLRGDLRPPSFIPFGGDNEFYHSSVIRIASSSVQIWTHFDLYDNILCQIVGTKRVLLFEPDDSKYLYVNGDKSSVNIFDDPSRLLTKFPLVRHAQARICHLKPGDCLFIPSLWWHNIRSVSGSADNASSNEIIEAQPGYTIGFNIFWRDPELASRSLYASNDIYGNKNLIPYQSALANIDKALSHLDKLPERHKNLHKLMLLEYARKKLGIEDMK